MTARRAAEFAVIGLYSAPFASALAAFALSAGSLKAMGAVRGVAYAAVCFLLAWFVWKRCETIWEGKAERLWLDAALALLFWAVVTIGGRGFGTA